MKEYKKYLLTHPKNSVEDKIFPVLDNPEVISKDLVAAKLKKIRQDYKKAADAKVVEVVSCFYSMISAKLLGEDLLLLQVCKRELILVAKLIKKMWIVY